MQFLDFFAGVGGFRRGLEMAGHKCIGFCEWDKYATASYTSMHLITDTQREFLSTLDIRKRQKEILKEEYRNGEWYSNDIRNVDARSMPYADCWCFGAPCQDFSVAGKRAGLEGDRSSLVREVFRILGEMPEEKKPEWLLYENVKGMFSSNKGFDYLEILLAMDELGYDIEWQLFNSKDWGVPQNRERVYTVGHLRARGERKIFPITGTNGENSFPAEIIGHRNGYRREDVCGILRTVRSDYGKEIRKQYEAGELDISRHDFLEYEIRKDGVTNTIDSVQKDNYLAVRVKEATKQGYAECEIEKDSVNLSVPGSKTRRRGRVGKEIANTLDCVCNQGIFVQVSDELTVYAIWYPKYECYIAIRKLTPKECFRLQGWTDDYFEKAAFVNFNSQLYKQAGNGVTVNVVYEIGERIY